MKQKNSAAQINVLIFCGVLALVGFLSCLLPKPTFSDIEKRELATQPELTVGSLFSGQYTADLALYYADTFPARDMLISIGDAVDNARGVRPDEIRIYESAPTPTQPTPPVTEQSQPEPPAQEETPTPTEPQEEQSQSQTTPTPTQPQTPMDELTQNHFENLGNIIIYQNRALNLFGSSDAMAASYANVINSYAEELPEVQIYNMVVPVSSEFYIPEQYRHLTGDQKANIDYIYDQLDPSIKGVDAYGAIASHLDEYVYFRTDHHWTALGAYYAYEEFCAEAGFEPVPLQEMERRTMEGFLGSFYAQTGDVVLSQNPDYVDYYIVPTEYTSVMYLKDAPFSPIALDSVWGEYAQTVNAYSVFLHGDYPLMHIETEHKNGRRLVLVKESYGNAFAPFMLSHFEEIFVVDQRYYQTALVALIEEEGVTDILFLNNAFAANTPYHIERINGLKYQVWTPPPPEEDEDGDEDED